MKSNVTRLPRHGQAGYYALADLPQREPIDRASLGTGWSEMDELLRFYPGQFIVTTGIAGSGKSTFWLNVICNKGHDDGAAAFLYVPENEQHVRARLERIWGVRRGFDEFAAKRCFIQSAEIEHYDQQPRTLTWILDRAVVAIERDGVDFILIDPWNEIERARPKDMLMTDYIGECLMWLKQFCRSYDVVISLVAHPTKEGIKDGKVPKLSDIEGSMNWYNKCDNGLIVVRDSSSTRVISAKVREEGAGALGVCYFSVDPETGLFTPQASMRQ